MLSAAKVIFKIGYFNTLIKNKMVKEVYLLRHGEAERGFHLDDIDRQLTPAGISQLTALAAHLKSQSFYPDHIYCSTAKRTGQTMEIIGEQLDYTLPVDYRSEIYEASVRTLFELVTKSDPEFEKILIVGHNPAISYLCDYLTQDFFGDMSPGKMVCIAFENQTWEEVSKGSGIKRTI